MEEFWKTITQFATNFGLKLLAALLLLVIGLKLCKWLVHRLEKSRFFSKLEGSVRSFVRSLVSIGLKILIFVSAALVLGIPESSFIAVLTSAGVAIGLALQGALSNFAGGLMILLFRPFRVGDYISTASGEGTVHDITVFYTVLITPDNKHVTLPNGGLTNTAVTNYSREKNRRVDLTFSVAYDSDLDEVQKLLLNAAQKNPLVLCEPAPVARLNEHADSSLNFVLRAWCLTENYWDVRFDLNETVKKSFDEHCIEIPFPQLDVHLNPSNEKSHRN